MVKRFIGPRLGSAPFTHCSALVAVGILKATVFMLLPSGSRARDRIHQPRHL
jgi:hypothetical protein